MNHDMTYCVSQTCPLARWCERANSPGDVEYLSFTDFSAVDGFDHEACTVFIPTEEWWEDHADGKAPHATIRCPACQGYKVIEVTVADPRQPCLGMNDPNCVGYEVEVDCPICDGAGYVMPGEPTYEEALDMAEARRAGMGDKADKGVYERAVKIAEDMQFDDWRH